VPKQSISSITNFEQPNQLGPERGVEQPFPATETPSSVEPRETQPTGNTQEQEETPHIVDKTSEEVSTKEVLPGDPKTEFADREEKEFITQITSELPNAKP